jgi:hypothetical protein
VHIYLKSNLIEKRKFKMIQKLKSKLLILSSVIMLALAGLAPISASAASNCDPNSPGDTNCITGGLCQGAQNLQVSPTTAPCSEQNSSGLQGTIKTAVNILSVIVGIAAVIMIIIGGFRYITSGGKQESVTAAKNTILYAVIGLVIVALAQVIVRFVLTRTATAG